MNPKPNRYEKRRKDYREIALTRPAPADTESERGLIGLLLQHPQLIYEVKLILSQPDYFHLEEMQHYYRAILAVVDSGKELRAFTVMQQLISAGHEAVIEHYPVDELMYQTRLGMNAVDSARHIKGMWIRRETVTIVAQINELAYSGRLDELTDVSGQLSTLLTAGMSSSVSITMQQATADAIFAFKEVLEREGALVGIPTGLRSLDFFTGGWLPSEVIVIAAFPGGGKTILICKCLLEAAKRGIPVGVANFEMSHELLIDRFASSLTGIPYKWIGTGRNQYTGAPLMHTEIAQIMDAYEYLRTLPIYFYDGENDIADVLLQVEDWVRRYGIKLMAYDYLQIMMDRSVRGGDSVELVSSISRKLKSAQRRLKIPFLEASQFNREKSQQGRPRMSNLKGSGQIEQDASVIIALDRWDQRLLDEEKDKAKAEGREPDWIEMTHRMDVDFLKYRTGAGDVLTFWEDAKTNRIDDKAPENWVELVKRRDSKPDPVDEEAVYEDLIAGFEKPKQVNLFGDQTNEELPIEPTF